MFDTASNQSDCKARGDCGLILQRAPAADAQSAEAAPQADTGSRFGRDFSKVPAHADGGEADNENAIEKGGGGCGGARGLSYPALQNRDSFSFFLRRGCRRAIVTLAASWEGQGGYTTSESGPYWISIDRDSRQMRGGPHGSPARSVQTFSGLAAGQHTFVISTRNGGDNLVRLSAHGSLQPAT